MPARRGAARATVSDGGLRRRVAFAFSTSRKTIHQDWIRRRRHRRRAAPATWHTIRPIMAGRGTSLHSTSSHHAALHAAVLFASVIFHPSARSARAYVSGTRVPSRIVLTSYEILVTSSMRIRNHSLQARNQLFKHWNRYFCASASDSCTGWGNITNELLTINIGHYWLGGGVHCRRLNNLEMR